MKLNDNTILRIKVPAHLYESVKAQLTLNEAKGKHNLGAGMEVVKEKKTASGDKPKAPKAPTAKKEDGNKKAPKDGMNKVKKKGISLEELKTLHELLGEKIGDMEEAHKGYKEPMEENNQEESTPKEDNFLSSKIEVGDVFSKSEQGMTQTSRMGTIEGPKYRVVAVNPDGTYNLEPVDKTGLKKSMPGVRDADLRNWTRYYRKGT